MAVKVLTDSNITLETLEAITKLLLKAPTESEFKQVVNSFNDSDMSLEQIESVTKILPKYSNQIKDPKIGGGVY